MPLSLEVLISKIRKSLRPWGFPEQPIFRALGEVSIDDSSDIFALKSTIFSTPRPMKVVNLDSALQKLSFSSSQVQAKPVKECPSYFESNFSFLSHKDLRATFESLLCELQKKGVDYDYKPLTHKIKCIFYDSENSSPCTFNINLFQAPLSTPKAKYLVEFQRRYGCVVVFRKFYQTLLQSLVKGGLGVPLVARSLNPLPVLSLDYDPVMTLDKDTLKILSQAVGSPGKASSNLEYLRETTRLLATLSKSSQNRAVFIESHGSQIDLCELIGQILQLPDVEVRRCGATFLGNLAVLETLREELITKLLPVMFQTLSKSDIGCAGFGDSALIEKETHRQIVRALNTMIDTHAKQVVQDPFFSQYRKILVSLKASSDQNLRADVLLALQQLGDR